MISICVTVKNRSRVQVDGDELRLFPNCVQSVVECMRDRTDCELVIADWNSDDWPLQDWLPQAAGRLPWRVYQVEEEFSRGRGRNAAADIACGEMLMFLDADCLLCSQVLRDGADAVTKDKAYFPVLYSFDDRAHNSGWWRHYGYGNCLVSREMFERAGRWPQRHRWGEEDTEFYKAIAQSYEVVREEVPGFYHQWHPDEVLWKDRFSPHYEHMLQETRKAEHVRGLLERIIPQGQRFILIDDTRLGGDPLPGREAVPMMERDGVYWGNPANSREAVSEFVRLRKQGVRYLAIAWASFWWLDHYVEFAEHLKSQFATFVNNDHLIVFDIEQQRGLGLAGENRDRPLEVQR